MTIVEKPRSATAPGLVEAAAAGDRHAFEAIYRSRVGEVGRYVRAILGDPATVDDAVAQTFLEAWRDLPRLRDPDRFDAWLLRIAYNRAMDATRRRRRERPTESVGDELDPTADPEGAVMAGHDAATVRRSLSKLSSRQRDVLVCRVLLGWSHEQTAHRLGISVGSSRQHQTRALRTLREVLG